MIFKLKPMFTGLICAVTTFNAAAGTIICQGTVELVSIHQPGYVGVMLSSMSNYVIVCRLDETYTPPGAASISPATCKALYAGLITARVNRYNIDAIYFDGDAIPASATCSNFAGGLATQVNLRYLPL
jgi:hypothetical protein